MHTLTYINRSIYQIKQSVLLSYVFTGFFFIKKISLECGGHVTLTFNFEEPIHIRVLYSHTKFININQRKLWKIPTFIYN